MGTVGIPTGWLRQLGKQKEGAAAHNLNFLSPLYVIECGGFPDEDFIVTQVRRQLPTDLEIAKPRDPTLGPQIVNL